MQIQAESSWRGAFRDALREFDRWRSTRRRGERIPETLWGSATALAGRFGVSRTATTLKLDYYSLKKRLELGGGRSGASNGAERPGAGFVEVSLGEVTRGIGCVLEIESSDGGSKLRLELQGMELGELESVIRSVWSQLA